METIIFIDNKEICDLRLNSESLSKGDEIIFDVGTNVWPKGLDEYDGRKFFVSDKVFILKKVHEEPSIVLWLNLYLIEIK